MSKALCRASGAILCTNIDALRLIIVVLSICDNWCSNTSSLFVCGHCMDTSHLNTTCWVLRLSLGLTRMFTSTIDQVGQACGSLGEVLGLYAHVSRDCTWYAFRLQWCDSWGGFLIMRGRRSMPDM